MQILKKIYNNDKMNYKVRESALEYKIIQQNNKELKKIEKHASVSLHSAFKYFAS